MLVAICALHLGIALMMGMILFGLIMILLNLAAFWPDEESGGAEVGSAKRESWPNTIRERATEKIAAEGI